MTRTSTKRQKHTCVQHRMHLDITSVVGRCADCDAPLPVPVLAFVTDDYVSAMPRLGVLVSWPTSATEVACA